MKKILFLVLGLFLTQVGFAQVSDIVQDYKVDGDLIETKIFFEDGNLHQTGFYNKKGVVTGEWVSYNREGAKTAVAQYEDGKKVGTWFFWEKGTLKEVVYKNSKIATVNTWINNGTQLVSNR